MAASSLCIRIQAQSTVPNRRIWLSSTYSHTENRMRHRLRGSSFAGLTSGSPAYRPLTCAASAVASGAPEAPVVGILPALELSVGVHGVLRLTSRMGTAGLRRG